jgi:hypothetical protein
LEALVRAGRAAVSVALSMLALGCSATAAGSPRPTLPTVEQAAVAYLAFVTAWNSEVNPANAAYEAAGSDPEKLSAADSEFASAEKDYIDWMTSHLWPAEIQPLVDQSVADKRKVQALDSALVADPLNKSLQQQVDALGPALQADGAKLRQALGLPPLATPPG